MRIGFQTFVDTERINVMKDLFPGTGQSLAVGVKGHAEK